MEYLASERFTLLGPDEFQGWAVTWGTKIDTWMPTRFWPGCFEATLRDRTRPVKLTWMHDMTDLVGLPMQLEERTKGLWLHGKMVMTRKVEFDYLPLVRAGVVDALSIGWNPWIWDMEDDKTVDGGQLRNIRKAELIEIAFVGLGADPKARIEDVAALRSHQAAPAPSRVPWQDSASALQRIMHMEALTAQYGSRRQAPTMTPVRPLFPAQGADRPETDSQYAARLEKSMEALLRQDESEAYYQKGRHQHAMTRADYMTSRQAMGW